MAGVNEYSTTASSNGTVNSISIAEGMATGDVNNAIRQIMADIASGLAKLKAVNDLTWAADKLPYCTSASAAALTTLSSFARTLLDDATAGAALTTLGVTAFAQTILDDVDAAAVRTTIGAQSSAGYTSADVLAKLLTVDGAGSGVDADLLDGVNGAAYWSDSRAANLSVTNGYQKLPSGLYVQWGTAAVTSSSDQIINFPIAFPNEFLNAVATAKDNPSATTSKIASCHSGSTSQLTISYRLVSNGGSVAATTGDVFWQAFGR